MTRKYDTIFLLEQAGMIISPGADPSSPTLRYLVTPEPETLLGSTERVGRRRNASTPKAFAAGRLWPRRLRVWYVRVVGSLHHYV